MIGRAGLAMGRDWAGSLANQRHLTGTGSLVAQVNAVEILGQASILNEGRIRGVTRGIDHLLSGLSTSGLTNHGLISATNGAAVDLSGTASTSAVLGNLGTLIWSHRSYAGVYGVDTVTNRGGTVELGHGNDQFDNRGGSVVGGTIAGEAGEDSFVMGQGAETVLGGDGRDTVDYRSGGGLKVSLSDGSGPGWATRDSDDGIEWVFGPLTGNDRLLGNT
jgi:hypothetical protein